jgi:site-specific DNA recombinase
MTNAVSLPSQRRAATQNCESRGVTIIDEYVESSSATDDRRPQLQKMIDRACSPDRPYDELVGYSFNRFFRNAVDMELAIRRLRKCNVELISITQPTSDDASGEMIRQIIGIFDEHASRENGNQTKKAMRESASQGFWNGATPPPGYKIVEAERRGQKIKKKLAIDPVEAERVRLIFRVYLEGEGTTGPLGVKETTAWLNANGYRTRGGALYGVGTVHRILSNECYATGEYSYGKQDSKNDGRKREKLPPIKIPVPIILELSIFQRVKAKLERNNPKVTAPRTVNGPSLLSGIAVCASCGSGMTRTGTSRRGKNYSYYSCAACHQKGKTACKGRHIPAATLDAIVLSGLKHRLLTPDRLASILQALASRQASQVGTVEKRLLSLQSEVTDSDLKLKRIYRSIEDGIAEEDDILKVRIIEVKAKREQAKAAFDRAREQSGASFKINPALVDAFARLVNEKLDTGDVNIRRSYISSIVDEIEVDDDAIRIIGRKDILQAVIAGKSSDDARVRGFVRKWRARRDSNS